MKVSDVMLEGLAGDPGMVGRLLKHFGDNHLRSADRRGCFRWRRLRAVLEACPDVFDVGTTNALRRLLIVAESQERAEIQESLVNGRIPEILARRLVQGRFGKVPPFSEKEIRRICVGLFRSGLGPRLLNDWDAEFRRAVEASYDNYVRTLSKRVGRDQAEDSIGREGPIPIGSEKNSPIWSNWLLFGPGIPGLAFMSTYTALQAFDLIRMIDEGYHKVKLPESEEGFKKRRQRLGLLVWNSVRPYVRSVRKIVHKTGMQIQFEYPNGEWVTAKIPPFSEWQDQRPG